VKVILVILFVLVSSNAAATQYEACVTDKGELYGLRVAGGTEEIPVPLSCKKAEDWVLTFNSQGVPGTNGADGQDGVDGINGVDGQDGADGVDGIDADPALEQRVVDLEAIHFPPECTLTEGTIYVDLANSKEWHTIKFDFANFDTFIGEEALVPMKSVFSIAARDEIDVEIVNYYDPETDPFGITRWSWLISGTPGVPIVGGMNGIINEGDGAAWLYVTLTYPDGTLSLPSPNPIQVNDITVYVGGTGVNCFN